MKTAFNPTTGEIVACGSHIDHLESGKVKLIDGAHQPGTGYVTGGQFVAYTPEQLALRDRRPVRSVWSNETMSWQSLLSLTETREAQWTALKQERDAAEFSTFVWDGSTFDCDATSVSRLQLAALGAVMDPTQEVDWTLADNTVRRLSASDLVMVLRAYGASVQAVHEAGRRLRAELAQASTSEQMGTIKWKT